MKIYKEYYDEKERYKTKKYYNDKISSDTMRYQNKYRFELNATKGHETWNVEADAFKHAYGSALISLDKDDLFSLIAGIQHEKVTPNNPIGEKNMDVHNNKVGREIARNIKKQYGEKWNTLPQKEKEDIIADSVWNHMQAGNVILDPSGRTKLKGENKDKSLFKLNVQENVNLSEQDKKIERYKKEKELFAPENRVFYDGEINPAKCRTEVMRINMSPHY